MADKQFIANKVLEKERQVIGTTPDENKDTVDFRVAVALGNNSSYYLDSTKCSKSSLGNLYTSWLTTYINSPAIIKSSNKMVTSFINDYDFRDDVDDAFNETFQKYLNGEMSIDDIKQTLMD
ncbi:hypothetical protein BGL34_05665 [Fructilactobacillus lindneri]|nr:hypothetical protein [Fructilactobacillus lindneri]ANZ57403.1 hypothetical protein AYR60_00690 [Fructilactobacillus lindneri]ANZ58670.1 hypothetical protein AYR59_00690 [Fructilactobacillus lindneri]POG97888.1 hypothetical protein BGL31_05130 [Fructilactobacillus lindneri]POG99220.1 hypothetical protein BGL32_05155 [Fructilactobacillus lindneri]POH01857.1 hypothetical protein BGL33_04925 [Fructilactobacillus lindneri]